MPYAIHIFSHTPIQLTDRTYATASFFAPSSSFATLALSVSRIANYFFAITNNPFWCFASFFALSISPFT